MRHELVDHHHPARCPATATDDDAGAIDPPRHHFPDHAHDWHQLVYAIEGVLTVSTIGQTFITSPDQAA